MSGTPLFKKLNLGTHREIILMNAPPSFGAELRQLEGIKIIRDPPRPKGVAFALAFAVTRDELDRLSALLGTGAQGDAVLWFAYPKSTSKRYRCEFNRDTGWDVLRHAGFDTVRAVAIDADWSALRFRRTQYIKR